VAGETIVFFPKYTSLCGATAPGTSYPSDPYDVTGYKTLVVETFLAGNAGGGAISAQIQGSSDLITWTNLGSAMAPAAGALDSETLSDPPRYVRVVTAVTAADDVATLWCKGVARDS
jgi:hypothetical protein